MDISGSMVKAAAGIVTKPMKAYQTRSRAYSVEQSSQERSRTTSDLTMVSQPTGEPSTVRTKERNARNCMNVTKTMTAASASGVSDFFKYHASSLVFIPLAFTDGLRAVPRLYGEEVRELGEVRDWKSGTVVGAKGLVYGIADGVSDVFVQPYQGGRQDGAAGAMKGLGKGVAGMFSKILAGTVIPGLHFTGIINFPEPLLTPTFDSDNRDRCISTSRHI
jgi:phage-related protein